MVVFTRARSTGYTEEDMRRFSIWVECAINPGIMPTPRQTPLTA